MDKNEAVDASQINQYAAIKSGIVLLISYSIFYNSSSFLDMIT